jgi:hypothetical protein
MKMQVTLTPEGSDPREWVVDRGNPSWDIAYATEKATDWGWLEFVERLDGMSVVAWRALLWALRKRDEHGLQVGMVEIDDWSEIELRIQCPVCEDWVITTDKHTCVFPDPEPEAEQAPAPKKAAKKKAGEPNPEA